MFLIISESIDQKSVVINSDPLINPSIIDSQQSVQQQQPDQDQQQQQMKTQQSQQPATSIPTCDNYSYVQLAPAQEFSNPATIPNPFPITTLESPQDLKKPPVQIPMNLKCKHCGVFYSEDSNRLGSCDYAPDFVKNGIETISGLKCAKCMVYHCMNDPEDDGDQKPCSCSGESCTKR